MKSVHQNCVDIFKELELTSGIYNLKLKNIPVWWFIRFRFYGQLYKELNEKEGKKLHFYSRHVSIANIFKNKYKSGFKFLVRSIFSIFLLLKIKKGKILFFTHTEDKKILEKDSKANLLIEKIFRKISDRSVILEQMSLNKVSVNLEKNLIFFDGIILIAFIKNILNLFRKSKIENWRKFEDKCKETYFENISSEWIIKTIKELIYLNKNKILIQVGAARIIVSKLKPRIIIENTSYNSGTMALNYVLKKASIPIIEIQHGFVNNFHLGYIYFLPENQKNTILPDKILVYGDFFKNLILESSNAFSSDNIKVAGSLKLNNFIKKFQSEKELIKKETRKQVGFKNNDFVITLTSDSCFSDFLINFFEKSMPLFKNNIKLCIKLHPMDNEERETKKYKKIINNFNAKILTDDTIDLYYLLVSSDLHVTIYSTVFLECLSLGVPNIIIDPDDRFDSLFSETGHFKKIIKVNNPADFSEKINDLAGNIEFLNKYKQKFGTLGDYFFDTRKDTEKIIIEEIKNTYKI